LRESESALRAADQRKDRFLATLAHELRNPLAPVMNALEIMRRAGGEPAVLRDALATMHRQMTQMVRMIDDLMDITRITRDTLDLRKQRVVLSSVVSGALESCLPIAHAMGHEVRTSLPEEPIELDADPTRLTQVFSNLLSNACKFTGRGGMIEVSARRLGPDVVVRVSDTGIGISKDQLPDVFQMFSQVEPTSGRQPGLGIGLHLVQRLVELHGGSVIARSEGLGHGSEFLVTLPVLVEPPDAPGRSGHARVSSPATPSRRILVVDDNEDAATSLSVLLKLTGHDAMIATDGTQALQKAVMYQPDVILLDIDLPKMNGYDVCRAIRKHAWGRSIVMIALTGWGQDEDREKSKTAGFDGHLVKPVDHAALMKLLAEAVSS
jgi:CheY-like chemotaxis protein/two-component sensor histidine kinase